MACKFKKGDSIFFLFRKGETVQDSQRKPRFYLDRTKAEIYLPYGDEIVEYAPIQHGRWEDTREVLPYIKAGRCSVCHALNKVDKFCPVCGSIMDSEVEYEPK